MNERKVRQIIGNVLQEKAATKRFDICNFAILNKFPSDCDRTCELKEEITGKILSTREKNDFWKSCAFHYDDYQERLQLYRVSLKDVDRRARGDRRETSSIYCRVDMKKYVVLSVKKGEEMTIIPERRKSDRRKR